MTDEDVIARAAKLMELPYRPVPRSPSRGLDRKDSWRVVTTGVVAARWMQILHPLMHSRRREQIDSALLRAATQEGISV